MITIELTREEAETVCEVLHSYLSDLQMEIRHTDNRQFREGLKRKESFLKGLLGRLESPKTAA